MLTSGESKVSRLVAASCLHWATLLPAGWPAGAHRLEPLPRILHFDLERRRAGIQQLLLEPQGKTDPSQGLAHSPFVSRPVLTHTRSMAVRCGHCGGQHESVADVRECSGDRSDPTSASTPPVDQDGRLLCESCRKRRPEWRLHIWKPQRDIYLVCDKCFSEGRHPAALSPLAAPGTPLHEPTSPAPPRFDQRSTNTVN